MRGTIPRNGERLNHDGENVNTRSLIFLTTQRSPRKHKVLKSPSEARAKVQSDV